MLVSITVNFGGGRGKSCLYTRVGHLKSTLSRRWLLFLFSIKHRITGFATTALFLSAIVTVLAFAGVFRLGVKIPVRAVRVTATFLTILTDYTLALTRLEFANLALLTLAFAGLLSANTQVLHLLFIA